MTTPNAPVTLSPEKTIAGISVETFSYVFLGIGLIAPIVFLIIVFISMKCYSNRKFKRYKKYEERLRITREIWDMERRQYFHNWKGNHSADDIEFFQYPPASGWDQYYAEHYTGVMAPRKARKPLPQDGTVYSNSNPDVFFKETPALLMAPKRAEGHVRAASSPGDIVLNEKTAPKYSNQTTVPTSDNKRNTNSDSLDNVDGKASKTMDRLSVSQLNRSHSVSVNSEEAKALESFDQIYQDMDLDSSTVHTNSEYDPSSLLRSSAHNANSSFTTNYESVQCERTQGYESSDLSSASPSKGCSVQVIEVDLHHLPTKQCDCESSYNSNDINSCNCAAVTNNKCGSKQTEAHDDKGHYKLQMNHKHFNSSRLSQNTTSSIIINDTAPLAVERPHNLPIINTNEGYATAIVSTVTPTHLNSPNSPTVASKSNGLYFSSPAKRKLIVNSESDCVSYVNNGYLSKDSPTDIVTKL